MLEQESDSLQPAEPKAQTGANALVDRRWSDVLRCFAMTGVFCEHWFEEFPVGNESGFAGIFFNLIYASGCLVQLFFLLSGYALTISLLERSEPVQWSAWLWRRIRRVLFPFWIACLAFFVTGQVVSDWSVAKNIPSLSIGDLLANLALIRNQIPSARLLNASFWFIPVIIGLYLCFPILWKALRSFSPIQFFIATCVIQATSTAVAFACGWDGDHTSTVFLFHLVPFAVGMLLASAVSGKRLAIDDFAKPLWCFVGVMLIGLSLLVSKGGILAKANNDVLSAFGLFLLCYFVYANVIERLPWLCSAMILGGQVSFIFYLIHLPLLNFATSQLRDFEPRENTFRILGAAAASYLAIMVIAWTLHRVSRPRVA